MCGNWITVLLMADLWMATGSHSNRPHRVGTYGYENVQPSSQKGNVLSMSPVGACWLLLVAMPCRKSPSTPLISAPFATSLSGVMPWCPLSWAYTSRICGIRLDQTWPHANSLDRS